MDVIGKIPRLTTDENFFYEDRGDDKIQKVLAPEWKPVVVMKEFIYSMLNIGDIIFDQFPVSCRNARACMLLTIHISCVLPYREPDYWNLVRETVLGVRK